MSIYVVKRLCKIAVDLSDYSEKLSNIQELNNVYGLKIPAESDGICVKATNESIQRMPADLVRDTGVTVMGFKDLGESKEYYPNHGRYLNGALVLNSRLIDDPYFECDPDSGLSMNKLDQTLYHELGHGWDDAQGSGRDLSLEPEWLELSGWSEVPKPGLKRIIIREPGQPVLTGEYFYNPDSGFTRFYAKRNPWDDWADSFAYYVGGLKSFLPENKIKYFDEKLGKYYKGESNA